MGFLQQGQSTALQWVAWGIVQFVGVLQKEKGRVFTSALFLIVFPFLFFLDNSVDKTKVKKIEAE